MEDQSQESEENQVQSIRRQRDHLLMFLNPALSFLLVLASVSGLPTSAIIYDLPLNSG